MTVVLSRKHKHGYCDPYFTGIHILCLNFCEFIILDCNRKLKTNLILYIHIHIYLLYEKVLVCLFLGSNIKNFQEMDNTTANKLQTNTASKVNTIK